MPDLLIELLSEEIPAGMQARAAENLKKMVTDGLVDGGLTYAGAAAFATPRRLTLAIEGLLAESPTTVEDRKGPKVGAPEKAIEGFLRGAGVSRDALEVRADKKGEVYFARITNPGRPAPEIIAAVLDHTIRQFPWPKSMRWGAGSLRWVRPLQNILCILTDEAETNVVPLTLNGFTANNRTRGHRFMAPDAFSVTDFADYEAKLKAAHVVLSTSQRADTILAEASNMAFAQGLELVEDPGLLQEVAGLVEWPVVLMGQIDDAFLDLPPEVLQTSMREHQKFFSAKNPKTGRIEKFVTVANRETADNGATILAGNQKVLSARLADAKFFWENDLRVARAGMADWSRALELVTFHNKLGSVADLIGRMADLASILAPTVGADPDQVERAARLAKADLSSEMVYEFPELQGLMGRYYSEIAGEDTAVAVAAEEHYAPLGPSDAVPSAPVSVAVSLAEKLDKLTGFWAIDERPTGSKDPFALRRAALGVIRLVLENHIRLPLLATLRNAIDPIIEAMTAQRMADTPDDNALTQEQAIAEAMINPDALCAEVPAAVLSFLHDRLKVYLRDQGIRHDVIDACIAMPGNDDLALLVKRAEALQAFLKTDDGENLLQGFKRANNILSQAEQKDGVEYSYGADPKYAEEGAEKALFTALDDAEAAIGPAMEAEDFAAAMSAMAALRAPIDQFFTDVQVNADSEVLRRNRLNLLSRIRTICLSAADLTRIES